MKQKSINERVIEEIVFNQIEGIINGDAGIEVIYNDETYQKVHQNVQNVLRGILSQESIKKLEERGYYL